MAKPTPMSFTDAELDQLSMHLDMSLDHLHAQLQASHTRNAAASVNDLFRRWIAEATALRERIEARP